MCLKFRGFFQCFCGRQRTENPQANVSRAGLPPIPQHHGHASIRPTELTLPPLPLSLSPLSPQAVLPVVEREIRAHDELPESTRHLLPTLPADPVREGRRIVYTPIPPFSPKTFFKNALFGGCVRSTSFHTPPRNPNRQRSHTI